MTHAHPEPGPTEWLKGDGPIADIVMSSRVRLARNIAGIPFVSRATAGDRTHILEIAQRAITDGHLPQEVRWIDLANADELGRHLLVERHLISSQHAKSSGARAVAISTPDERLSIMVNEEDHFRIQFVRSGFCLGDAFDSVNDIDDRLEESLDYAFSSKFGYLTACPTNVGTGLRLSVMLHLPALKITGDIEKAKRAAKAMSLAVRGFYGEGSEAVGDFFQISNQTTLGKTERDILARFNENIIPQIIEYERVARKSLLEKRSVMLEDRVFRAFGTLRSARLLKADEALELLSHARLGVALGVIKDVPIETVNRLVLISQPAHLQQHVGRSLTQAERRVERATVARELLGGS
ncbi:MAG: protein arginine kinase [Phycisphaerales bacterium]